MTQGYTPDGYQFTATYDAENRLASIEYTDSGSTVHKAEYIYSGYGFLSQIKRYENSNPVGDIRIMRSGYLAIQERDATNQVVREYTWGLNMGGGIGGLLNMRQGGNDYKYLYDGQGNVSALLNTGQQVAAVYRYDSFGNLMAKTGTLDQPFMFSTKRYDVGTGLSYYGYRFYAPTTGKWLTRDPLGEAGGINLYGFPNDPINSIDPFGLAPWWIGIAGEAATGTGLLAFGVGIVGPKPLIPVGLGLMAVGGVLIVWDWTSSPMQGIEKGKELSKPLEQQMKENEKMMEELNVKSKKCP